MPDETLHEIQNGDGFVNKHAVLVSVVVESHECAIIFINAGGGDHRVTQISANVFEFLVVYMTSIISHSMDL